MKRNRRRRPSHPSHEAIITLQLAQSTTTTTSENNDNKKKWNAPDQERENAAAVVVVKGLLSPQDWQQGNQLDVLCKELQDQLPFMLLQPLTTTTASKVYTPNVQLTVAFGGHNQEIVLLESRDELISLSDVVVLATLASQGLSNGLLLGNNGNSNNNKKKETTKNDKDDDDDDDDETNIVQCQLHLMMSENTQMNDPTTTTTVSLPIIMDTIRVPWKTRLPPNPMARLLGTAPSAASDANNVIIVQGLSEFQWDPTTGKIQKHVIRNVTYNGQILNGPAIGQAIQTIQSNTNALFNSGGSIFGGVFGTDVLTNVFNDVRTGLLEQAAATAMAAATASSNNNNNPGKNPYRPRIYPLNVNSTSSSIANNETGWIHESNTTTTTTTTTNTKTTHRMMTMMPVPGTDTWKTYRRIHEGILEFCDSIIPLLSESSGTITTTASPTRLLLPFLDSKVQLLSQDNEVLLEGSKNIANYYHSLALARKGTGGTFEVTQLEWLKKKKTTTTTTTLLPSAGANNTVLVAVDYKATILAPPSSSTTQSWAIQGRDVYTLLLPTSGDDDSDDDNSDDDDDKTRVKLVKIRQEKFAVSSGSSSSSSSSIPVLDAQQQQWLMKNWIARTIQEQDRIMTNADFVRDVLTDLILQQTGLTSTSTTLLPKPKTQAKRLSTSAAANVYYIMSDLHQSIKTMLIEEPQSDTDKASTKGKKPSSSSSSSLVMVMVPPPAGEYMMEDMELKGYLGETLVRGVKSYHRAVGTMLAVTRQSMAQRRLILEQPQQWTPKISLTDMGNIQVSLTLSFRVPPPPPLSSPVEDMTAALSRIMPNLPNNNLNVNNVMTNGVPFQVEILSEYGIDPMTGRIQYHRLLETRVNGQLTPGDVLSKWLLRFLRLEQDNNNNIDNVSSSGAGDDVFKTFWDTLSWLRTFSEPPGEKKK